MILEADVTFVVLAAAIEQQFVGLRPFVLTELAVVEHFFPLRRPQVVFYDGLAVQVVGHGAFVDHDLTGVPFAERFGVLRFGRNHVVQRSRLAVAVHTQFGVGVVFVVEHLIFGSRNENRLVGNFLSQIEHAAVGAFVDFPFEFQFEILELLVENNVAAVLGTGFAHARSVDLDGAVFDGPCRGHVGTVVSAPSVERFAVEEHDPFVRFGCRVVGRFLIRVRAAGSHHGRHSNAAQCIDCFFHIR